MPSAKAERDRADGTRSVPATFRGVNGYEKGNITDLAAVIVLRQHPLERLAVARLVEDPPSPLPTIENVVDHPSFDGSGCSRHDDTLSLLAHSVNISDVPFSGPETRMPPASYLYVVRSTLPATPEV